jgi:predicted nucleic acid binding AN1-type Zn finger protein
MSIPILSSPFLSSLSSNTSIPEMTITETPKSQKRCGQCKKKLMLSDFECKCGTRFCASHRYPQEHACSFDYRAASTTNLGKQLVKCAGERLVDKI